MSSKRSNMHILILLFFYLNVSLTLYEYKCGMLNIFTKIEFLFSRFYCHNRVKSLETQIQTIQGSAQSALIKVSFALQMACPPDRSQAREPTRSVQKRPRCPRRCATFLFGREWWRKWERWWPSRAPSALLTFLECQSSHFLCAKVLVETSVLHEEFCVVKSRVHSEGTG